MATRLSVALLLAGFVSVSEAEAQSIDIPLQYEVSSNGVQLFIYVGVGSNGAQKYLFDTGSNSFNLEATSATLGSQLSSLSQQANLPTGLHYSYSSGLDLSGNQVGVPSLTFYSPGNQAVGTIAASGSGGILVDALYAYKNGSAGPTTTFSSPTLLPGFNGYGVFGAGYFTSSTGAGANNAVSTYASPLGQAVVPGTTGGYVVAANGQSLRSLDSQNLLNTANYGNGPQANQSITSCSPSVMLGLTPALLAQFPAASRLPWNSSSTPFPNSNYSATTQYGINLDLAVVSPTGVTTTYSNVATQFDSGKPINIIYDAGLNQHSRALPGGSTLIISPAGSNNAAAETQTTVPVNSTPQPYTLSLSNRSDTNPQRPQQGQGIGVSFYLENSVLYDLSGRAVAYTSNFVTDQNLTTMTAHPLVIDAASPPLGLAGVIAGDGGVTIGRGGAATLSNANTYHGATSIDGGSLALVGPGTIANSSGVGIVNYGVLDISGAGAPAVALQSLSGDATAQVVLGDRMLAVLNGSGSFSGVISGVGGGVTLAGGFLGLTGTNTYTGATNVLSGILQIDGSIGSSVLTSVAPGASLAGSGTVGNLLVFSQGTFAPGSAAGGSMSVSGNLTLEDAARYLVRISSAGASFTTVNGTASLGGDVQVLATGGVKFGRMTILSSAGLNGTTFNSLSIGPAGISGALSYTSTAVQLALTSSLGQLPGAGSNQKSVGLLLDNVFNSAGTTGALGAIFSGNVLVNLQQATGETAAGSQQVTFNAMNQFVGLLTGPDGGGPAPGTGVPAYAEEAMTIADAATDRMRLDAERNAYAMFGKAPLRKAYEPRWSVWASGFGGSQSTDGNASVGSSSATSRIFGTAVGADYLLSPRTIAGFALAGGGTSFSVGGLGSGRSDLFQAGAYVRHNSGPAYVSGALAYGWQDVTTDRTVTIAGSDRLRAEFKANAWSGRIEGGYRFVLPWTGGIGLTPYAAGQFTTFDLPAYAEQIVAGTGAFALAYGARSVTDTRSELGVRTDKSLAMSDGVLALRGRMAWAHDVNPDRTVAATFQSLPGASFVVNGAAQAPDAALATVSAEMRWLNGWSAGASFESELSQVTRSYAGKGVVRYAW
ncbi:autotransporter family protein [Bradyrhizobium campsiandrae]|uniref:Autotransporter domain-containing protein n=1 Tax=Bradyrhizobium campsiandrae TaxID=1729892 RepID=A0ABR7U1I6_9BRAD|nr:autotransporter outer membrane beta-barrel domain-containing protein [Bradyrhizobium campsiandrae]MBC9977900.1 autotransporter domain-containing protein [Bradyrhizobium campsiandrae]